MNATHLQTYAAPTPGVNPATRPLVEASTELLIAATETAIREHNRDILTVIRAELQHREGQNPALLRAMISGYMLAPVVAPAPAARIASGPRKPTPAELRELWATTRDSFGVYFRASCAAMDAADADLGRDAMGQARWPRAEGTAWRVRLSDALAVFVHDRGQVSWRSRVQLVPAARYWPGGVFPEGLTDAGPADVSKWRREP